MSGLVKLRVSAGRVSVQIELRDTPTACVKPGEHVRVEKA